MKNQECISSLIGMTGAIKEIREDQEYINTIKHAIKILELEEVSSAVQPQGEEDEEEAGQEVSVDLKARKKIMKQWDSWRKYIADGGKASWPRDAFESLLDGFQEKIGEGSSSLVHDMVSQGRSVEGKKDILLLKLNKRLAIYQKAINKIDDYFEYRYAQFDREEIRKHVYDVLDNLAKKLEATK